MNLIADPILTLAGPPRASLPALLAAMARGEVRGFPALRPHQRPAWHMFLVQLSALALWTAGRDGPPPDEETWAEALRGLTPDHPDDSPWRLAVADRSKPAFLQAPVPDGLKWSEVATPDALDMLIAARNHDLKQAVARQATAEDWVYALVSLQTCEGYGGKGNNGIARMNGGSSSRPLLGLVPAHGADMSIDPSAWWARDVKLLLAARGKRGHAELGTRGGPALLWCLDWPEDRQLDIRTLDPWFIEICRRVRLTESGGRLCAQRATSKGARIDAKALRGNTGDPWTPVNTSGKSLTLGERGDFHYRRLYDLLFSRDWNRPLLACPGDGETGDMIVVAEAFARGNSKTGGFKSRVVPVPGRVVPLLSSNDVGRLASAQIEEIESFDKAMGFALALTAAGGKTEDGAVGKKHFAHAGPARKRFDRAADRLFFPSLWHRTGAVTEGDDAAFEAKRAFLADLWEAAKSEFETTLPSIPCPAVLRPRAEARARRALRNRVWKLYHLELFDREGADGAV